MPRFLTGQKFTPWKLQDTTEDLSHQLHQQLASVLNLIPKTREFLEELLTGNLKKIIIDEEDIVRSPSKNELLPIERN